MFGFPLYTKKIVQTVLCLVCTKRGKSGLSNLKLGHRQKIFQMYVFNSFVVVS